jgi:DNA-binding CsgD family transcriptional regulator
MDLAAMTVLFPPQQFKRSSSDALYDREALLDLLLETLDLVDLAIALVDRGARVLYANRAARIQLSDSTVVRLSAGRLVPFSAKSSAGLRAALASFSGNRGHQLQYGAVVPLADVDGVIRAASWMLPLAFSRLNGLELPGAGCVALFLREIGCRSPISGEFFTRSYGVTQAELRLLARLAEGKTMGEAGQVLHVSLNTVKSHLKNLFAKTGTTRQAELMRLVLNSVPPASMPDDALPLLRPVCALTQSIRPQPSQPTAST